MLFKLFLCHLSSTANRHMLRALAQAGGGAYEFFDVKTKHNWAEKVRLTAFKYPHVFFRRCAPPPPPLHCPLSHPFHQQVERQVKRMASPGCTSVSVKWQQFNPAAQPPVQAPQQLHALFNDCRTLVYGFVPHCTQVRSSRFLPTVKEDDEICSARKFHPRDSRLATLCALSVFF